jgi:hypothetical protein
MHYCYIIAVITTIWLLHKLLRGLRLSQKQFPANLTNNCYYRLATHFYHQGTLDEAQQLFQQGLHIAGPHGYRRAFAFQQLALAAIDLGQKKLYDAEQRLIKVSETAYEYQERVLIACTQVLFARLHILRSDLLAARAALIEAIDLFERVGMRRELAEARAELAQLEA